MKIPFGYVYLITNRLTGEIYVGQHKLYNEPWRKYLGSSITLSKDIELFGKENFIKSFLTWAYTAEELNKLELEIMREYRNKNFKMYNRNFGSPAFPFHDTWNHLDNVRRAEIIAKTASKRIKENEEKFQRSIAGLEQEIIKFYQTSGNLKETAKRFCIPRERLRNFLIENTISINSQNAKGRKISDEKKVKISEGIKKHNEKLGRTKIPVELPCSHCKKMFVRMMKKDENIKSTNYFCSRSCSAKAPKSLAKTIDIEELKKLYLEKNLSIASICVHFNCKKSTMYSVIKSAGIKK